MKKYLKTHTLKTSSAKRPNAYLNPCQKFDQKPRKIMLKPSLSNLLEKMQKPGRTKAQAIENENLSWR